MQAEPAEPEENDSTPPENPLVLHRSALDHANRVAADAERIGDAVKPLLGVLEHLALGTKIAQDGLPARNVFVESTVGAVEKVLLPQRVRLARVVAGTHAHLSATIVRAAAPIAVRRHLAGVRRVGPDIGVWVLGRRGRKGPPAQQLGAGLRVLRLVALLFQDVELLPVVRELRAKIFQPLEGLFLLRDHELVLG